MKKQIKNNLLLPPGHKKPVTRRDFIAHGLVGASSYLVLPSLVDVFLSQRALGSPQCPDLTGSTMVPLIVIDLAGGASLSGNWLPLDKDGAQLPKYRRVGIPEKPMLDNTMGAPIINARAEGVAGIYTAMRDPRYVSPTAIAGAQFGAVAVASFNDSTENTMNFTRLAAQAGLVGQKFEAPLTNLGSASGGYARDIRAIARFKPLFISDQNTPQNAQSMGAVLNRELTAGQRQTVLRHLARMGTGQLDKLRGMNAGEELKAIMECALGRSASKIIPSSTVDPAAYPEMVETWQIAASDPDFVNRLSKKTRGQMAAIVHNVLQGNAGSATVVIGGCDYHNGQTPNQGGHGDVKEQEIGELIGRIIQSAYRYQVPVAIALISDGSVGVADANLGSRIWTNDDSGNSMAVMGFYDPKHNPATPLNGEGMIRTQTGSYNYVAGAIERMGVASSEVSNARQGAYSLFLNYMALNFKDADSRFASLVGDREFPTKNIAKALLFNPKDRTRK